jgi:hypothetical protein
VPKAISQAENPMEGVQHIRDLQSYIYQKPQ